MKTAVVIPAFNEAERLPAVLKALMTARDLWDELVVVDDGSSDGTAAAARRFAGVRVVSLPENRGKGAAMWAGIRSTDGEVICFLDADLIGLTREHVRSLLAPVRSGAAEMSIGLFHGGRRRTDFSHRLAPWVSGQRAVLRRKLIEAPEIARSRLGVEALLTRAAERGGWRVAHVAWEGVTHCMKEEKLGALRGFGARLRMYGEILGALLRQARPAQPFLRRRLRRDAGVS